MREAVIYKSNGQLSNPKVLRKFFDELPDGKFLLTAKNIKRRSNQQNAYLHGVVIPLVFEGLRNNGYNEVRDNEDAKEVIKHMFLKRRITDPKTGEIIAEITRHTHELTTAEMVEFIDNVIQFAAEYLNVQIPLPNEQMALL